MGEKSQILGCLIFNCFGVLLDQEKKRRKQELSGGTKRIKVWNSPICKLGNYHNSLFVYVWVQKTLTLIIKVFLVGLSQFCGWF